MRRAPLILLLLMSCRTRGLPPASPSPGEDRGAEVVWSGEVGERVALPPALSDGGVAVVITASGKVLSVDVAGRLRPLYDLGEPPTAGPVLSGDTLIVGTFYGNLYFLDLTGSLLFKDSLGTPIRGIAVGGGIFAVGEDGKVVRYAGTSRRWVRYVGDNVLVPPSITPRGDVVVATISGDIIAYDTAGVIAWMLENVGTAPSSPSVRDSVVAVGFPDGRLLLLTPSGYRYVHVFSGITGEVSLSDSGAVLSTYGGSALRVVGDSILWETPVCSTWVATSPVSFKAFIVAVCGDGTLSLLSYDGKVLDSLHLKGDGWMEPLPFGGGLLIVSGDGRVYYVALPGTLLPGWPLYRGTPRRSGSPYG